MSRDEVADSNQAVFDLLADWRCRTVLAFLQGRPGERVPVRTVIEHVVAVETEAYHGDVPLEYPEYVTEDLRRAVLPRLSGRGLIDHDGSTGMVRYRPSHAIEEILRAVATNAASGFP